MQVVLLRDVKEQGKEGDVVNVSEGYARNFLFPQNLAVPATPEALRRRDEQAAKKVRDQKKALKTAAALGKELDGFELEISVRVNEQGKPYAAVTADMIAEKLKREKFDVDADMVELHEPIKDTGERDITINLPHGFEASIRLIVTSKET